MNRRRFLAGTGGALVVGSGCLSLSESAGTEPLSGSFETVSEDSYWHHSAETDRGRDSPPSLAVHDDIYVALGHNLSRLSLTGTERWTVETRTAPVDLETTDLGIYYSGGWVETAPVLAAHSSDDGSEVWWTEPEHDPKLVDATTDAVYSGATLHDPASAEMPVNAIDAESGEPLWRAETGTTQGGVVTHDLCLVESYPATLVAFATASGAEQWRHSFEDEINGLHVIDHTLTLLSNAGVTTYDLPSGVVNWNDSIGDQEWLATDGDASESTETIFVGGSDGTLRAIDLSSGEIQWSNTPPAGNDATRIMGIAQGHNRVVVQKGDTLLGLNATDGREQWRQVLTPLYNVSPPLISGETVFLLHSPKGNKIQVKTFDGRSGERRWRFSIELTDNLIPRYSVADDRVIVATHSGDVYGFGSN